MVQQRLRPCGKLLVLITAAQTAQPCAIRIGLMIGSRPAVQLAPALGTLLTAIGQ